MKFPCNLSAMRYESPDGRKIGLFNPSGRVAWSGPIPNEAELWTPKLYSARIFLGFNVGRKPTWKMGDVTEWVKRNRRAQGVAPNASFIYQKGIWTHTKGPDRGKSVTEKSTQIVLLNLDKNENRTEFKKHVLDLAQDMVRHFRQEEVVVDFQLNGISKRTAMVTP